METEAYGDFTPVLNEGKVDILFCGVRVGGTGFSREASPPSSSLSLTPLPALSLYLSITTFTIATCPTITQRVRWTRQP
jgi:hypothetical protein